MGCPLRFHLVAFVALLMAATASAAVLLQNPDFALSVIFTDAPRAREFYFEGLGMTDKGEALTSTLNGDTTLS
jgi:hypothetical protein